MSYTIDQGEMTKWTPKQLAEALADLHLAVACRDDALAHGGSPVYLSTELATWAAVKVAYAAEVEAHGPAFIPRVRDIRLDCGESIAYCVRKAEEMLADELAQAKAEQLEHAVWHYAVSVVDTGVEGYWIGHLARYFPAIAAFPASLAARTTAENHVFDILIGTKDCPCGTGHEQDRRMAAGWGSTTAPVPVIPAPRSESVARCGQNLMPWLGARPADLVCGEMSPCWRHDVPDAR